MVPFGNNQYTVRRSDILLRSSRTSGTVFPLDNARTAPTNATAYRRNTSSTLPIHGCRDRAPSHQPIPVRILAGVISKIIALGINALIQGPFLCSFPPSDLGFTSLSQFAIFIRMLTYVSILTARGAGTIALRGTAGFAVNRTAHTRSFHLAPPSCCHISLPFQIILAGLLPRRQFFQRHRARNLPGIRLQ